MNIPAKVTAAYARIAEVDRPEIWITLRDEQDVLGEAKSVADRLHAGEHLPLAGLLVAVKDNVDVAGLPTTAACPAYAYQPGVTATAVQRLVDAGALVLGKTNLDQFATGLVGTRSPHGAVRNAFDPDRISGGSSSGSAVAVALGIADIGIGTDTAGSGRIPAAFNAIIGIKPTLGLVPNTGVVPACRSYDSVTVFASTLSLAQRAIATMTGPDPLDPRSRTWPPDVRLAAGPAPLIALPRPEDLAPLSPNASAAFQSTVDRLADTGARFRTVDISGMLAAARLLYDGALVAERHAAVGEFVDAHPAEVDPVVGGIISAAGTLSARDMVLDLAAVDEYRAAAAGLLAGCAALLLPTAPEHPSLSQVAADPVGVNRHLGLYTNFVNLLDMAAVAVPAGEADGGPFGVTLVTRAFEDQLGFDIAALLTGEQAPLPYPDTGIDLVVFGAHLRGQPLNEQLVQLGARYSGAVRTAPEYRMVAIAGSAAFPGQERPGIVHTGPAHGAELPGERWTLSPAALGRFLGMLALPMSLGGITLSDGSTSIGFHCDLVSAQTSPDITGYGGWLDYLARR
jgi:allophanate hydrolase